jgi:Phosphoenolpyruvate synthase/pyruvate phosphate dikinase
MNKFVFNFNSKEISKLKDSKNLLGGKGTNLAEMGKLGFPVPNRFYYFN